MRISKIISLGRILTSCKVQMRTNFTNLLLKVKHTLPFYKTLRRLMIFERQLGVKAEKL